MSCERIILLFHNVIYGKISFTKFSVTFFLLNNFFNLLKCSEFMKIGFFVFVLFVDFIII